MMTHLVLVMTMMNSDDDDIDIMMIIFFIIIMMTLMTYQRDVRALTGPAPTGFQPLALVPSQS